MGKISTLGLVLCYLVFAPPVGAQIEFLPSGGIESHPVKTHKKSPPYGWKLRYQMGAHVHLTRDAFWDNLYYEGHGETRIWLSWDLGIVHLNRDLDGWGGGVFVWASGDYGGALGLKGYRRWSLGHQGQGYFQAGPGIILGVSGWEQDYQYPGYLLEAEIGTRYVALSTSLTLMPYTGRHHNWYYDGLGYVESPGDSGLDVAWNAGMKLAGPFAIITTTITSILLGIAIHSIGGLN